MKKATLTLLLLLLPFSLWAQEGSTRYDSGSYQVYHLGQWRDMLLDQLTYTCTGSGWDGGTSGGCLNSSISTDCHNGSSHLSSDTLCCLYSPTSTCIGNDLVNGNHSSNDCTVAGGTVVTESGDKFCRFNVSNPPPTGIWEADDLNNVIFPQGFEIFLPASTCPSGWAIHESWSTTTSVTCDGGAIDYSCSYPNAGCTTGSHSWGNTNPTPEICPFELYQPSCSNPVFPNNSDLLCWPRLEQIGCY